MTGGRRNLKIAKEVEELLNDAVLNAGRRGNEYVTPEHVWFVLADRPAFQAAFKLSLIHI